MLNFFARCFEGVCTVLAFINFILFGIIFALVGYYLGDSVLHLIQFYLQ